MTRPNIPRKPMKARQNDSTMATNNSSIISKRSVERLYYPQPHFYQHFVKKPLRRSPLINRGYWLRMYAIDHVVRCFLDAPGKKQKVVLNLGCGYDPLAFQWLSREISLPQSAKFIDIDFPELIEKKCNVIVNTPHLRDIIGHSDWPDGTSCTEIRSRNYAALGCDLVDLGRLERLLANEIDTSNSLILCTAEVSVTYMNVEAADALIQWAAHYDDIQFCLLEQFLPAGPEHPFARKMIQHFNNLQTPLRSIQQYPRLNDQRYRFQQAGWPLITLTSLWDFWSDHKVIPSQQKKELDAVEPFDEWEEFVLFASHYFILTASKTSCKANSSPLHPEVEPPMMSMYPNAQLSEDFFHEHVFPTPISNASKFGALFPVSLDIIGHYGGSGSKTRLEDLRLYGPAGGEVPDGFSVSGIEPRMCHSISAIGQNRFLLAGGRASPNKAFKDCWILCEQSYRVDDLPIGLFRHCATQIEFQRADQKHTGVLIYGGRTGEGQTLNQWLLWCEGIGWVKLHSPNCDLKARFGAVLVSTTPGMGLLMGGMDDYGTISAELWEWTILDSERGLNILLKCIYALDKSIASPNGKDMHAASRDDIVAIPDHSVIGRFGACLVDSALGLLLIGGVSSQTMAQDFDILKLVKENVNGEIANTWSYSPLHLESDSQRPLLVGHAAVPFRNGVVVAGGGAVCFSFGSYWNQNITLLHATAAEQVPLVPLGADIKLPSLTTGKQNTPQTANVSVNACKDVEIVKISSDKGFEQMVNRGHPAIIRGSPIGPCTETWTMNDLKAKIGADRKVIVHESTSPHMTFQQKNFSYVKKSFGDFIDEVEIGSRQYLRSIASQNPSVKPANFWSDFPELASDYGLPPELALVKQNMHSSVLRISGPVTMWLHYDVMANVLCQIRSTKRLLLYPPSDVSAFSVPPGASSSSINCFEPDQQDVYSLASAHPHQALLNPGDILFIPALWLHTASPVDEVSISVNVFFRSLDTGYAPGRDVYGNRDVQAYEKGRVDIQKMVKSFSKLPPELGSFYLHRLGDELKAEAEKYGL